MSDAAQIRQGELITEDRPCHACGYNVRGLAIGGRCPECGETITYRRKRSGPPPLGEAPTWYLGTFSSGLLLMALSAVGFIIQMVSAVVSVDRSRLILFLCTLAWTGGVYLTLIPRPVKRDSAARPEWPALRLTIAVTQACAVLAVAAAALAAATGAAVFRVLAGLLWLAAIVGWPPLTVYLSLLADWAGDSHLMVHYRGVGWMLAVCGVLFGLGFAVEAAGAAQGLLGIFSLVGLVAGMLWVISAAYGVILIVRTASMVAWARQNADEARERDVRRTERLRRQHADLYAKIDNLATAQDFGEIDEHLLDDVTRKHFEQAETEPDPDQPRPGRGLRIEPAGDVKPYDLED